MNPDEINNRLKCPLCEECGNLGLCSTCAELWEAEIDLEDMEAEEEERKQKKRKFAACMQKRGFEF